jgi:penicillin-binding protein 2
MARKNQENDRYKSFTRRAILLGGAQAAAFTALGGRLYYLQVVESDKYAMLAEDNRISPRLLPPPRGLILDRKGVELAGNEPTYRAVVVPEQARDMEAILTAIAEIVPLSEEERARILKEASKKRAFVPITVKENLTWQQVSTLEVNAPSLPGVTIETGQIRTYPYGVPLAHIVGYVAAVSEEELTGDPLLELPSFRIGKNGVERQFDLSLRGRPGTSQVEVNAVGRVIRELAREEGTPGQDLQLTLDSGLQHYVYGRLSAERSATAVVLDVERGEVLALGSYPSYDPSAFTLGLSRAQWNDLSTDPQHPLINKTVRGTYAPGSTFKMVVALAAQEMGIGGGHEVYCPGHMTLGDTRFHCWKRWGHGKLHMVEALQQSCDVYFYDLAKRVGIDNIAAMARRLGLGAATGIELPGERDGLVPTKGWKLSYMGESWQAGETLVASIGQGFMLTSPLQLAVMTARLASGKAVTPTLLRNPENLGLEQTPREAEPLGIPEEHLQLVRSGMDAVTNDRKGTAYRARIDIEGMEMAGKTGTSQVRRITMAERAAGVTKNEDLPWRRRDHALFVAFAPVEKPRYACAVVVEHGGGGSKAAAPIARDILIETQRRDPLKDRADEQLAEALRDS